MATLREPPVTGGEILGAMEIPEKCFLDACVFLPPSSSAVAPSYVLFVLLPCVGGSRPILAAFEQASRQHRRLCELSVFPEFGYVNVPSILRGQFWLAQGPFLHSDGPILAVGQEVGHLLAVQ